MWYDSWTKNETKLSVSSSKKWEKFYVLFIHKNIAVFFLVTTLNWIGFFFLYFCFGFIFAVRDTTILYCKHKNIISWWSFLTQWFWVLFNLKISIDKIVSGHTGKALSHSHIVKLTSDASQTKMITLLAIKCSPTGKYIVCCVFSVHTTVCCVVFVLVYYAHFYMPFAKSSKNKMETQNMHVFTVQLYIVTVKAIFHIPNRIYVYKSITEKNKIKCQWIRYTIFSGYTHYYIHKYIYYIELDVRDID